MSNLFKFAENILNNLDQTTQSSIQTALHKPGEQAESLLTANRSSSKKAAKHEQISGGGGSLAASSSSNSLRSSSTIIGSMPQPPPPSQLAYRNASATNSTSNMAASSGWPPRATNSKEDELINFLNNSEVSDLTGSGRLSKSSSRGNLADEPLSDVKFIVGSKSEDERAHSRAADNDATESAESDAAVSGARAAATVAEVTSSSKSDSAGQNDSEKKMLKSEIASLNQEVKSLTKRIKTVEEEHQRSKRKIENYQTQISDADKIIRELRAREDDMSESLRSKDAQLAILRVRFEETDTELKARKIEIESIRQESQRILRDHTNSSDLQSQVFENLKEKLTSLEVDLQREKETFAQVQREHLAMQSKLEMEKQSLAESLQTVEKRLNDEKSKSADLSGQLKSAKASSSYVKQEFDEYKNKAMKTLQSKDKLIATLKESAAAAASGGGSVLAGEDGGSGAGGGLSLKSIEIDELTAERDFLKEELATKSASLEIVRAELMELESQMSAECESLRDQLQSAHDQHAEMRQSKEYIEQDMKNLRQQLEYAQDELYKQKSNLNGRVQEREAEIERLRSQLTTKSLGTTTEKELENRLHLLTENLIQKQTLIEALQSEKHSIFLQLERSEKRLHDYETIMASKKTSTSIRMHDEDESTTNKLPYLKESPFDHEVTRKVKRAATEIDKFSIRLGVFLKRYPIARIFVIFYMFLLHLWVVVVLFTYKPEAHDSSYDISAMPHHPVHP